MIGADLLQHFYVTIDPTTATVRLSDPHEMRLEKGADDVIRLPRENVWSPRRALAVELGGSKLHPVIDTGTSGTHIDGERLGLEWVRVREGAIVRASGADGMVVRDIYFYEEDIGFAGQQLQGVSLISRESVPWKDGLLGLNVLGQFHQEYDWRRGRARLVPIEGSDVPSWREWQHNHIKE